MVVVPFLTQRYLQPIFLPIGAELTDVVVVPFLTQRYLQLLVSSFPKRRMYVLLSPF